MMERRFHDGWLLFLAFIALVAELGFLLHQLRLIRLPFLTGFSQNTGAGIGQVLRKTNFVQGRAGKSLTWLALLEGDAIRENDTVMTAANSSAVIRLREGGELVLEPFTLLRFERGQGRQSDQLTLEVDRGRIKVRAQSQTVTLAVLKRKLALQPRSEITLTSQAQAQAQVQVESGAMRISSEESMVDLRAGEAAAVPPTGPVKRLTRLVLTDPHPSAGTQVLIAGTRGSIAFYWQGDDADTLEWDQNPEMESARIVPVRGKKALVVFGTGKYYWRVGGGGAFSSVMGFSVLPQPKYRMIPSRDLARLKEGMPVPLRWSAVAEATGYILEFSRDRGFQTLEKRVEVSRNEAELEGLEPGKYFWRVRATQAYLGDWPPSQAFELQIRPRIEPPKLKGAKIFRPKKPGRGKQSSKWAKLGRLVCHLWNLNTWATQPKIEPQKIWIEFSWDASRGAGKYRMEVSARRDFKTMLAATEVESTSAALEVPDRQEYYWRVVAIDEDGDLGKYSPVQKLKRAVAKILPPPERAVAQIPPPPPDAAEKALAAIHSESERPRLFTAWLGYGGTYLNQSFSGAAYVVSSSGFALNRVVLGAGLELVRSRLETHFWMQPLYYFAPGAATPGYQQPQLGADLLWSEAVWWKKIPFGFGLRLRSETLVTSSTTTALTLGPIAFSALLLGTTWDRPGKWPLHGGAWLEAGPLGTLKGIGVVVRQRIGIAYPLWGLAPAVEVLLNPQYRSFGANQQWNLEASVSVILQWTPLPATLPTPKKYTISASPVQMPPAPGIPRAQPANPKVKGT